MPTLQMTVFYVMREIIPAQQILAMDVMQQIILIQMNQIILRHNFQLIANHVIPKVLGCLQHGNTIVSIFQFTEGNTKESGICVLNAIHNHRILPCFRVLIVTNIIRPVPIMTTPKLADMFMRVQIV